MSKSGRDPVLTRVREIKEAFHSTCPNATAAVILISGDIAFSGEQQQYESARLFVNELRDQLKSLPSVTEAVDFVVIPGNHDCDFRNESDTR